MKKNGTETYCAPLKIAGINLYFMSRIKSFQYVVTFKLFERVKYFLKLNGLHII